MSITDDNFYIPKIYAETVLLPLVESANKPFIIGGIDKRTLEKDGYVVKLNNSERMTHIAAMRETVASLIAIELGIPSPFPVIVEISKEFIDSKFGFEDYQRFNESIGINYGNKYLGENTIQFMPSNPLSYQGIKKNFKRFLFLTFLLKTATELIISQTCY